jgi:hypothetical protein
MSNIFIGALFVFLNFTININGIKIGLIPDFIGYIIMVKGLAELENESPYFLKAKGFAKGMAVYTAILYAMDLFGLSYNFGIVAYLLGIASIILTLYTSYMVVKGIEEMEAIRNTDLNAESLYSVWKVHAGFTLAACVLIIIPFLSVICLLVSFVAAIVFLVALNKSKKLYYSPWNQ